MKRDEGLGVAYSLPMTPCAFDGVTPDDVDLIRGMVTLALMSLLKFPEDPGANEVVTKPGWHAIVSAIRDDPLPRVIVYCSKFLPEGVLWVPPDLVKGAYRHARVLCGIVDP